MHYVAINLLPKPAKVLPYGSISHAQIHTNLSLREWFALSLRRLSVLLLGTSLVFSGITFGPQVAGYLNNRISTEWVQILTRPGETFGDSMVESGDKKPQKVYQPAFDATLSTQNRLIIEKIGFDSPIGEDTADAIEETLKDGVWRVWDFGTPYARKYPTIFAAHRYGYLEWTNDFRRKHSFYNLPKLTNGDRVKVLWNQRTYVYEIIDSSEGEEITNYQADLILYTCKFLDSKTRIFKYAKLVEV
jgi:sortase (surface protein transpeptidase)